MMRIITGRARGVRLVTLDGENTRPTSERAKEAIFSSVQSVIPGSRVLDLFAGSGQMALEAVSRGASSAVLCDRSRDAVDVIRRNAELTKLAANCEVRCAEFDVLLAGLRGGKPFDLVFLDPPYRLGLLPRALRLLTEYGLLSDRATVVCEAADFGDVFGGDAGTEGKFSILRDAKYGVAHVRILSYVGENSQESAPARKETLAIVPGSFDPMTIGHLDVVERAAREYDKVVVAVMVNAAKQGAFDMKTREEIAMLTVSGLSNVSVITDTGMLFELYRKLGADAVCKGYRNDVDLGYENDMAAWNRAREPEFRTVLYRADEKYANVSSTEVRARLAAGKSIDGLVSPRAVSLITAAFEGVREESGTAERGKA